MKHDGDTVTMLKDGARAVMAAMGLLLAGLLVSPVPTIGGQAARQQPAAAVAGTDQGGESVGPSEVNLLQQALEKGGAFALIAVILFFYRRDWKTAVEFWKDQHAITTILVKESTAAKVEVAAALRENTVVVHQAKHVMERYLPELTDRQPPPPSRRG